VFSSSRAPLSCCVFFLWKFGKERAKKENVMASVAAQATSRGSSLIAVIADEDTVTGFLLAGVGNVDLRRKTNYLVVDAKTTVKAIEDAFKEFTTREDIAIILISQYVANMIRFMIDSYQNPIPSILEIPSKDHPYDPSQDSILSRVKHMFSSDPTGSTDRV
jgi:V-type H+-transporting ATPase subunit F